MANRVQDGGLAVVVVNYGSSGLLRTGLVTVADQLPGVPIIVVDNRTSDTERETVRALSLRHGWHLETPEENLGFGAGCNRGVAAAIELGATRFLLLNPDAVIDVASVIRLDAAVIAHPLTLAAPEIRRPDGSVWSAGNRLDVETGRMLTRAETTDHEVIDWLSGACLLLGDELWRLTGGFQDEYFLYWEDVDLSVSVVDCGGRLEVVHAATAVHDVGGTQISDGRAKSDRYYYYNVRNRLLFAHRHLDRVSTRRWRRSSGSAAYEILLRGGRRQFLHPVAPLSAVARGLIDGTRGRWGPVDL